MKPSSLPHDIVTVSPILKCKVWGGARIADRVVEDGLSNQPIGERWNVADLPTESSPITSGELSGRTLNEAIGIDPARFLGEAASNDRFPLLVKLIDAAHDLSIQVHPHETDPQTKARSKDEAWVILESAPGSQILHGFVPGVDRQRWCEATKRCEPEKLLRHAVVNRGDVVHVPPGTVHAICGGVFLLEIQQPSDTTYRIWDYDRPGLDGKKRPLHLDEAMKAIQFEPSRPVFSKPQIHVSGPRYTHEHLLGTPHYLIERLSIHQTGSLNIDLNLRCAQVVTLTKGSCSIMRPNGLCHFDELSSFIVPAFVDHLSLQTTESCELVIAGYGEGPLISSLES